MYTSLRWIKCVEIFVIMNDGRAQAQHKMKKTLLKSYNKVYVRELKLAFLLKDFLCSN